MTIDGYCHHCDEPFMRGEAAFCVTCDHWLDLDCLEAHATVEPDGEGDWRHTVPA